MKRWLLICGAFAIACVPVVRPTPGPVTPPPVSTFALTVVVTDAGTGRPVRAEVYTDSVTSPWRQRTNTAGFARKDGFTAPGWNLCAAADSYETHCEPVGEARSRVVVFSLKTTEPPRPTRADVLTYRGHLANLRDGAGRVIWTPALPGAPPDVRRDWLQRIAAAGGTHVPIGPFGAGPAYPGVPWDNPDWTADASAIRGLVLEILRTPGPTGRGMVPVVFTDGGPRDPRPRLERLFPTLRDALDGLDESVLVLPAGWEPVPGDFTSAEVSWALERWHAYRPRSLIGYHGQPNRLVGSSNPIEADDPWQGGEAEFYTKHGGQYIDIALFQTPHGRDLYEPCGRTVPKTERDGVSGLAYPESCWKNRFDDYVARIGAGLCTDDIGRAGPCGWRKLPIVLFETIAYEFFPGRVDASEATRIANEAKAICDHYGVACGFGNGLPDSLALAGVAETVAEVSEHEVRWIDAAGVTAAVKDRHAVRDGAVLKFPGEAMGPDYAAALDAEYAQASRLSGSGPHPAGAWAAAFANLSRESIGRAGLRPATCLTPPRTAQALCIGRPAPSDLHRRATVRAGDGRQWSRLREMPLRGLPIVWPASTVGDVQDRINGVPVVTSDIGCSVSIVEALPDYSDLIVGQPCELVLRTAHGPVLRDHVSGIVGGCAQEQVIGSHAASNVARVADHEAFRDWPVEFLPGEAMGDERSAWGDSEAAVAVDIEAARPDPAAIGFADLGPEPVVETAGRSASRHTNILPNLLAGLGVTHFGSGIPTVVPR